MNRQSLDDRLRELGLYSEYYYRKEMKTLRQLLKDGETLNCLFTGVHEANRKMVAVTGARILILWTGALGSGEIKVIRRDAVTKSVFEKKLPFSSVTIWTTSGSFLFTNVQRGRKDLFEWAMELPVTEV